MKLTIDASIVIKWFITEPLCDEARLLLARRIQLHAPDLVLSEFANTIWKKVRRNEIQHPPAYLDELPYLLGVITLHSDAGLTERAAQFAIEFDHPIYDCLYLACAEATDSDLITADKRFVGKVAGRSEGARVHCIGTPGVADRIEALGASPIIERDKIQALVAAYDAFEKTHDFVLDTLFGDAEGPRILSGQDQDRYLKSPPYRRLVDLINRLDDEERVDLLALGWFGAGLFPSWRRSVEHAGKMLSDWNPNYAAGYGRYWQAGYSRVASKWIKEGAVDR